MVPWSVESLSQVSLAGKIEVSHGKDTGTCDKWFRSIGFFEPFWAVLLRTYWFKEATQIHPRNRSVTKGRQRHSSERVGGKLGQTHIVLVSPCFFVGIFHWQGLYDCITIIWHLYCWKQLAHISTRFRDKLVWQQKSIKIHYLVMRTIITMMIVWLLVLSMLYWSQTINHVSILIMSIVYL